MKFLKAIFAILSLVFLISALSDISNAVSQATIRCINIIIPSLFIMMVFSRYIVTKNLLKPVEIILRPLAMILDISAQMTSIFLISNIGGYPIGASLIAQMQKEGHISKKDASVIASYCFSSGPAFVIGAVGLCVYGSKQIGYLMFISCVLANTAACIIYNRVFNIKCITNRNSDTNTNSNDRYTITDAISDSGKALLLMCCVIIAFSIVNVVLEKTGTAFGADLGLIAPLFEITSVASFPAQRLALLPFVSGFVSFGGICVWLQNSALVGKSFDVFKALLLRIPVSVLNAVIFKALYSKFSERILITNADFNGFVVNIDNFLPSICLIIMIFLLINKKRLAFLRNM